MELPVGWGISTLFIIFRPRFRVLFLMRLSFADNLSCFICGIVFSRIVFCVWHYRCFSNCILNTFVNFLSLDIEFVLASVHPDPLASFSI